VRRCSAVGGSVGATETGECRRTRTSHSGTPTVRSGSGGGPDRLDAQTDSPAGLADHPALPAPVGDCVWSLVRPRHPGKLKNQLERIRADWLQSMEFLNPSPRPDARAPRFATGKGTAHVPTPGPTDVSARPANAARVPSRRGLEPPWPESVGSGAPACLAHDLARDGETAAEPLRLSLPLRPAQPPLPVR